MVEREKLIDEYWASLALVRRTKIAAQKRYREQLSASDAIDCQHLSSMERDLLWAIEYLETGRLPDYHRGIYKWTVPIDPQLLQKVVKVKAKDEPKARWVTSDTNLSNILSSLTPREREAFILIRGQGISFRETARYMGVRSPGTITNLVKRAERKIRREIIKQKDYSA